MTLVNRKALSGQQFQFIEILLFIIFISGVTRVQSQSYIEAYPPVTLPNTEIRILHSTINGITYKLSIALPINYALEPGSNFPVLYLLDADYSFPIAKNICDHLAERNNLPSIVLVAIGYAGPNQYQLNRTRDYTPTQSLQNGYSPEVQKNSGGGPNFLNFMESELIPFIEKNFRVNKTRGLVGHSYGGLFANWVLTTKPDLFKKYIIVSPSIWYDNNFLLKSEESYAKTHTDLNARVYMAVGEQENPQMSVDLSTMAKKLDSRHYKSLNLRSLIVPEENHNTVYPIALTKGLRFIFQ